jgi:hypothetical protein
MNCARGRVAASGMNLRLLGAFRIGAAAGFVAASVLQGFRPIRTLSSAITVIFWLQHVGSAEGAF